MCVFDETLSKKHSHKRKNQKMTVCSKFLLGACRSVQRNCVMKLLNLSGTVLLRAEAIDPKFDDLLVATSTKEIEELRGELTQEDELAKNQIEVTNYSESTRIRRRSKGNKERQRRIFDAAYRNVTRYSNEQITKEYEKNSQKWQDWCNDVFIYIVYDFHLNQKPMPIQGLP
jgi:hypothetical protein